MSHHALRCFFLPLHFVEVNLNLGWYIRFIVPWKWTSLRVLKTASRSARNRWFSKPWASACLRRSILCVTLKPKICRPHVLAHSLSVTLVNWVFVILTVWDLPYAYVGPTEHRLGFSIIFYELLRVLLGASSLIWLSKTTYHALQLMTQFLVVYSRKVDNLIPYLWKFFVLLFRSLNHGQVQLLAVWHSSLQVFQVFFFNHLLLLLQIHAINPWSLILAIGLIFMIW